MVQLTPANVLTTEALQWPLGTSNDVRHLPPADCIQMKAESTISIRQSIIHIITLRHLRAAHIFTFRKNRTDWQVFQPSSSTLSQKEVRGSLAFAIREVQKGTFSLLQDTTIEANTFITSQKSVLTTLENIEPHERIFIILVFKKHAFATGNYYDEHTLCQAILDYIPTKETNAVWNKQRGAEKRCLSAFVSQDLSRPKRVRW